MIIRKEDFRPDAPHRLVELAMTGAEREHQRVLNLVVRHDKRDLRRMRGRTERRIDFGDPGPRSVVVALTWLLLGLVIPLPVARVVPILLPGAVVCVVLGLPMMFFLHGARRRAREYYATHRAWRILNAAARYG